MAKKHVIEGFAIGTPVFPNDKSITFQRFPDPITSQDIYIENEQGEYLSKGEKPKLFKTFEDAYEKKGYFDSVYFVTLMPDGSICEVKEKRS